MGYDRYENEEKELKAYLCPLTFDYLKLNSEPLLDIFDCKAGCIEFSNKLCTTNCSYPNVLRTNDNRFCDFVPCSEQKINKSEGNIYPCGSSVCYELENSSTDCTECLNEAHYYLDSYNICKLKECTSREVNSSDDNIYPCGTSDCYQDIGGIDENKCVLECTNSAHYSKESSSNGKCGLKECSSRLQNSSNNYPCGFSDCYSDGGECLHGCLFDFNDNLCHTTCSNENHYYQIGNYCVAKSCSTRTPNESGDNKCGIDNCYVERSSCTSTCSNPSHYEVKSDGACGLKECNYRLTNNNVDYPCGNECYLDKKDNYKCTNSCSDLKTKYILNGVCYEKNDAESNVENNSNSSIIIIIILIFAFALIFVFLVVIVVLCRKLKNANHQISSFTSNSERIIHEGRGNEMDNIIISNHLNNSQNSSSSVSISASVILPSDQYNSSVSKVILSEDLTHESVISDPHVSSDFLYKHVDHIKKDSDLPPLPSKLPPRPSNLTPLHSNLPSPPSDLPALPFLSSNLPLIQINANKKASNNSSKDNNNKNCVNIEKQHIYFDDDGYEYENEQDEQDEHINLNKTLLLNLTKINYDDLNNDNNKFNINNNVLNNNNFLDEDLYEY
jgi:hypothetical protein